MTIEYICDDRQLTASEYVALFTSVWRLKLDIAIVQRALNLTINITARDCERLVGCGRVLTDGYLFSVLTEVVVYPDYSKEGVDLAILKLASETSPTSIEFGSQATNEPMMQDMGWVRGPTTYFKNKPLPTTPWRH